VNAHSALADEKNAFPDKEHFLPFYSVPTRLYALDDQIFIQCDETEDMIPGQAYQRTEGQGRVNKERQVFHHLLRRPFFHERFEHILTTGFIDKPILAQ
jgi:hypothetical protein